MEKDGTKGEEPVNLFRLETYADSHFKRPKKGLSGKKVAVRSLLQWQKGALKGGLLLAAPKDSAKLFTCIQGWMGDVVHKERDPLALVAHLAERALNGSGAELKDVRDELYCQLVKQLTFNPGAVSLAQGWLLLAVFAQYFPPSGDLNAPILAFCQEHLRPELARAWDDTEREHVQTCARFCLRRLPKTVEQGARGRVPDAAELASAVDAPLKAPLFGVTLQTVMDAQREVAPDAELPLILTVLCSKISALKGAATEGIFRVPGDVAQMTALRLAMEGGDYAAESVSVVDPHVPGSLLKLWLRELEQPLVPSELYDAAIAAAHADTPAESIAVAEQLPELNRRVAAYVVEFLRALARPENVPLTKMGMPNLAMVFAPNFLRCPSEDLSVIFNSQKHQQTFVRHLIEDWRPSDSLKDSKAGSGSGGRKQGLKDSRSNNK